MKIEKIDLIHFSQPLVRPFVTSFGRQEQRQGLLIALHADGLTGWGECVAGSNPGYSYETVETAWHIATQFLIPNLLGQSIAEPEDLAPLFKYVRGHPMAKAMFDAAAWDLTAQRDGLSFAQKLAAPYPEGAKERVQVGVSIGIQESLEATKQVIAAHLEQGYGRIKLKIRPGHDLDFARQMRASFPEPLIMLDANSAYTLDDAPLFAQMDDLNLLMIEQPLGYTDILDHSKLRPQIQTPLCLDESIHSTDDTRLALALDACDIINIKPGRVGGWTEARKIHDLCRANGIDVWIGGMLETGIGRAGQLALAALPGVNLPGDISATERYYQPDIVPPFTLNAEDSTITVPTGLGLGVTLDMAQLRKVTVRAESF